ncbi:MAG TPA: type II secretion system secretin GspD, partial [Candidatus Binatia bacterium]|nr:type II secretion system secretin GspD [Candidatus Binatia bacterium]
MVAKRVIGFAVGTAAATFVVPLMAQQPPSPNQPSAVPPQTPPGVNQPAAPAQPGVPPAVKPPVIPRRVPAPGEAPAAVRPQEEAPAEVQPGEATTPEGIPAHQTTPARPQRRIPPGPAAAGGMVSLNFNRADLIEIIHIIAQQLRLTYTIDPEVKGSVTINSAEPLRSEDLLPIFHQILRMNGAVAVRTGNLYHIMPIKDGKGLARPVGQSREDSFALQVIPVRFFAVAEMKRVLTPFLQPGGEIIEHPRGNFLVVMDLPSNIQRLVEIADLIDVQVFAGTRMEIYQPKVASAEELAQEMGKVMQSFAASAPQAENFTAQFLPLPRINQLLVISHSEAAWTYAKRWLERIDVVAEGPGRRIFIYPVENGKATELADVLTQALGLPATSGTRQTTTLQSLHRSTTGMSQGFGTTPFGTGRQTPGTFGAPGTQQQGQPFGAYAAVPAPGQPVAPAAPAPAVPPPGVTRPPTAPGAQAQRPEEQQRIVADPATNSLIIYGTAQEFQNIKTILKDLDAVARQVLMDVLVAEVTLTDDMRFGVDYQILTRSDGVRILGRTFPSHGGIITGVLPQAATSGLTQFPTGISGVIGRGDAIRAFINAFAGDSRFKVLSSPSVLATDNRPARIQVGTEEPVPTGTITQTVGTIAESTSIQYRNTGRIVTIIPQVNSQGLVNLQILAEVSQRGANVSVGPNDFPSFDVRQAETTAVVQDGETLVIGGIITDSRNRTRSGIPYLMDIPVLGRFFGRTVDEVDRTELIMLITPHVIRSREESRRVTEDFKKSLSTVRNELERMSRERERLQQRPLEERPALPGPAGDIPPIPPAPTPAPTLTPHAPVAPMRKSDASQPGPGVEMRVLPRGTVVELKNSQPRDGADLTPPSSPPARAPQAETQPAYALSL